jgi:hypothetical protein
MESGAFFHVQLVLCRAAFVLREPEVQDRLDNLIRDKNLQASAAAKEHHGVYSPRNWFDGPVDVVRTVRSHSPDMSAAISHSRFRN